MLGSNVARGGLRTGLRPAMAFRPIMLARPTTPAVVSPQQALGRGVVTKRMYSETDRGGLGRGKSKLIFRFGWRDIPIELYPMAFVVLAGVVGATVAITRHCETSSSVIRERRITDGMPSFFLLPCRDPSYAPTCYLEPKHKLFMLHPFANQSTATG